MPLLRQPLGSLSGCVYIARTLCTFSAHLSRSLSANLDIAQFQEVTTAAITWIRDNEPGTLQFEMFVESPNKQTEEGVTKVSLFER